MAYSGDSVRQAVEIMVQAQGLDELGAVRAAMGEVSAEMAKATETAIAQGRPIRDLVPELAKLGAEYTRLAKAAREIEGQRSLAESFVGLGQITEQAGALADSLTKVDVSLNGLMASAFKVRGVALDQQFKADAQAAKDARQAIGEAMRARVDDFARAEQATVKFNDSLTALAQRNQAAGRSSADFGRQMLFASYAMQDFYQAGLAGVLNNVPQIAMAFGKSAETAGTIAIAALGVDIAFKTLGPTVRELAKDFGLIDDPARAFIANVSQAKAAVEALTAKPHKVQVDFDRLNDATKQLEEMERRLSAFNSARESDLQGEMAKQAKGVVTGYGGGRDDIEKAVGETEKAGGVSHAAGSDEADLRKAQGNLAQAQGWADMGLPVAGLLATAKQHVDELEAKIKQANVDWAKNEVGAFIGGDAQAIQRMQNRAQQFPGAFSGVGPGGVTAREAIANLPSTQAEALRRLDQESDDKDRQEKEATGQQIHKKAKEAAKERLDTVLNAAGDADDARKKAAAQAGKALDNAAKAMEKDAKAGDKALADGLKAGDREAKAADRAENKADHLRETAAAKLTPAFRTEIGATLLQNRASAMNGGPAMDEDRLAAMIEAEVGRRLAAGGQNPGLAHDVTRQSREHLDHEMAANLGRTGDLQSAMIATMGSLQAEQGRIANLLMRNTQALRGVRANQARAQNRRPSLLMGVN